VSTARFNIEGLAAFKGDFKSLSMTLTIEAEEELKPIANAARDEMYNAYPVYTGNLRKGLRISWKKSPTHVTAKIENKAPHATIFEIGVAETRHYSGTDKLGRHYMNASRGMMPPGKIFIPRMIKYRRKFYALVRDIMVRRGLIVTGEAA